MAELCRTGCVQNSGCGPRAVSEKRPTSGSPATNQESVHKIRCCGVFKISPSLKHALFPFLCSSGTNFHRPTTFIRQPIFQRTVDDTDLQDACDVCLNPAMRLASSCR